MGWAGVTLKPSTVLIFSVALGIAIDITIRFLVNYKQERQSNEQEQLKLPCAFSQRNFERSSQPGALSCFPFQHDQRSKLLQ